jgi:hypothetical protein
MTGASNPPPHDPQRAAQIAALNDTFRRTSWHHIFFTRAVADEGPAVYRMILARVRAYTNFTPANDPHGEHDFGSFDHVVSQGTTPHMETIFWKIDTYADNTLSAGADDPLDPDAVRVLHIMFASEY